MLNKTLKTQLQKHLVFLPRYRTVNEVTWMQYNALIIDGWLVE